MKVKLIEAVTVESGEVAAGEYIELSEKSAKALIAEGRAELDEEQIEADSITEKQKAAEEEAKAIAEKKAVEELAKTRKALDSKYKVEELAAAAKEAGVEFAFDAKKADIIEAIIAAGKAEALLA